MKKKVLLGGLLLGTMMLFAPIANAESYYTNTNNIEMTEEQYNKMVDLYGEKHTEYLTEEEFDLYKDKEIVDSGSIYVKENYVDGILVSEEEVTESEYESEFNSASSESTNDRAGTSGSHTTNYKKLMVNLVSLGNRKYNLVCHLQWKRVPAVKSYDVFAFMVQHFTYSSVSGAQYAYTSSGQYSYSYGSGSQGYRGLSNGAGISMNLKDGSNITGYDMYLSATLTGDGSSYGHGNALVSYQHAKADVTRAQSMSYTLAGTGLGGVIVFSNSSLMNTYDGMGGVTVSGSF